MLKHCGLIVPLAEVLLELKRRISEGESTAAILETVKKEYPEEIYPGVLYELGQYYQIRENKTKENNDFQSAIDCYTEIGETSPYYKEASKEIISLARDIQKHPSATEKEVQEARETFFSRYLRPIDSSLQTQIDLQFHELSGREGLIPTFCNVGSPKFFIQLAAYVKQSEAKIQDLQAKNEKLTAENEKLKEERPSTQAPPYKKGFF